MPRIFAAALLSACAAAAASTAPALEVKLTVKEPVGAERKAEPVSTGVCFRPGEVKDLGKLTLVTAAGQAVPAQFSPLVKLEDGSYQWALLDFQASVPAGGSAEFTVKDGAAAAPASPVTVAEAGGVYTVKNGPLEFVVDASRAEFELLGSLKVDGKETLKGAGREAMTCRDALDGNKLYRAGKPAKVEWDYKGPMRATLMLEGPYVDDAGAEWLGYRVRISCFAGSKLLRIEHCLRNSCAKEVRNVKVKDAYLRLGLADGAADTASTGKDFLAAGGLFAKHRLLSGYFSPGLHELAVKDKRLVLGVVPAYEGGYEPKLHKGYNNQDRDKGKDGNPGQPADYNPGDTGSWWLADCAYKIDEYWLAFGGPSAGSGQGGDETLAKALDSRLYALASCQYYSDTGALGFGPFGSLEDEVDTYKAWGWKDIEPRKADLLRGGWMKPMPGYHKASDLAHDETETDDAEGCLLMALRTGGRGYFDAGLAWAHYYANNFVWRMDFPYDAPRGKGKAMKLVGRDASDIISWGDSYNNGRTCGCHYYGAGAMDYYCITGEKELLLGSLDLARYARRNWEKKTPGKDTVGSWGTRGFGRQFMALVRIYEVTRDPDWKKVMDHAAALCIQDPVMIREDDWMAIHSGGSNGMEKTNVTKTLAKSERLQKYLADKGLKWDEKTSKVTSADGKSWDVYDMAGSWEQTYVQQGMERYWRITGSKEAGQYVVGFANFFNKMSWDPHCGQVGYRLWGVNFPEKGMCLGSQAGRWFPEHDTCPGPGAKHSGWYTTFGPDVACRAFNVSKDKKYLEQARTYWNRGSKWGYQVTKPSAPDDAAGKFAVHVPPKDDDILSTALMFHLVPRVK